MATPSVPPEWTVLQDEAASVQVAVPPHFVRADGMEGIVAQRVANPGVFSAEVWAHRAADVQPEPPFTEEVVANWLEERLVSWGGGGPIGVSQVRRLNLPAGEAIEVRASVQIDRSIVDMVAYGIPTAQGIADLRIVAVREVWDEQRADLALIPLLLRLSEP